MAKRWRIRPHAPDLIERLSRTANVPAVVAQILICRGTTDPGEVRKFLEPTLSDLDDPSLLPGCNEAAKIIHQAIDEKRRIVVYGDYDVDGITGSATLCQCLKLLGASVGYYIPSRIDEGYGLNNEAIRTLATQKTDLIITVDCGITSVDEVNTAREYGINLIITDHHEPQDTLPNAAAIVHPRLPSKDCRFGHLSGSAVAFKLAWAICQKANGQKKVSPQMREFLLRATGLAAMGTIADLVPLIDENRTIAYHGLRSLTQRPSLGMETLMRFSNLADKLRMAKKDDRVQVNSEDIAFAIAPRLNAAGRFGQAQLAVELLTTDQPERAEELALYFDNLNSNRKTLERSIMLSANKQAKEHFNPTEDSALVLADRGWHPGLIGIVAGRLADRYHRPIVLISLDQVGVKPGVGSARSVPGFNLNAALQACSHHLISHGGHAAAAGLAIEESKLDDFRTEFCEIASTEISKEQRMAELVIDAEFPLSAFTIRAVDQIELLAPFGQHNPRPLVCASGVRLSEPPKTIGSGDRHLSLKLNQHEVDFRAVAFGAGDWIDELKSLDGEPIDIAFRPVINTFRGRRSVEVHLVDWKRSQPI